MAWTMVAFISECQYHASDAACSCTAGDNKSGITPRESRVKQTRETANWDFLFHQSGMIGSAVLFQNAHCGKALREVPCASLGQSLAISFVAAPGVSAQDDARKKVSKIAKLMVDHQEF